MIKAQEIYYPLYQNKDKFIKKKTIIRKIEFLKNYMVMMNTKMKKVTLFK